MWGVEVWNEFNWKLYLLHGYWLWWVVSEMCVDINYGKWCSLACVGWWSRDNPLKLRSESCYIRYRLLCSWITIMGPLTPAVHSSNRKECVRKGSNRQQATPKLLCSLFCVSIRYNHHLQFHLLTPIHSFLLLFLCLFFHNIVCYFYIFIWSHLIR